MISTLKKIWLEQFPDTLTEEEKKQLQEYQEAQKESNKKVVEYFNNLDKAEEKIVLNPDQIREVFLEAWQRHTGKSFDLTPDTEYNLQFLCDYFGGSDNFKDKVVNNADRNKGLLICGHYGTGKTEVMRVIQKMFRTLENYRFAFFSANGVVANFENCESVQDKKYFWSDMVQGRKYFDDVKTEQPANNYGKKNVMKDILERRYENKALTYVSCNYRQGSDLIQDALTEFNTIYGGRVYDRIYEMFNIIEWKGKSFRA